MKRERADQDTETGFNPLTNTVERGVPAARVSHVFALRGNDLSVTQVRLIANDGRLDAFDKLGATLASWW